MEPAPATLTAPADPRLLDRTTVGVLVLCAVPMIVALVSASGQHWYPTGDLAQAELHMRGFFRHPPLVGAAGRIGSFLVDYGQGSHPGPAMWFALLPVYLLLGRSSFGFMVAMVVLQMAFICWAVWLVRRLAGPVAALALSVLAATLVHSLGPAVFIEAWNPWPALFAFFVFIAASWGVLCGRHRWLWIAATTGTFAVQCHAGYIPLVGAVLIGLAGLTLWRWRTARPEHYATWWWIACASCAALWIPPVLDQWRRSPGNLRLLFDHFTSSTEYDGNARTYVGLRGSLQAFVGEFSVSGPWVRGPFRQPDESPNWFTFIAAVAILVGALMIVRRLDPSVRRPLARLFVLLGGLAVIGVLATSRIFGEFYDYVIRWWWIIIAWTATAILLVAFAALVRRVGMARAERTAIATALVIAGTAVGLAVVDAADTTVPSWRNSALTGGLAQQTAAALDADGKYLVRWYDPATLGGVPYGVILELERQGYRVGVDAPASAGALPHRVMFTPEATEVLWVVLGQRAIDDLRARSDARKIAVFDQRSPAEIERSAALRADIEDGLVSAGLQCMVPTLDTQYGLAPLYEGDPRVPDDVHEMIIRYTKLGLPGAVFAVPTTAPNYVVETEGCD